jgi:hypothetical protein
MLPVSLSTYLPVYLFSPTVRQFQDPPAALALDKLPVIAAVDGDRLVAGHSERQCIQLFERRGWIGENGDAIAIQDGVPAQPAIVIVRVGGRAAIDHPSILGPELGQQRQIAGAGCSPLGQDQLGDRLLSWGRGKGQRCRAWAGSKWESRGWRGQGGTGRQQESGEAAEQRLAFCH